MSDDESRPGDIRLKAMDFLARREHSRLELRRKLRQRFEDAALVDAAISQLCDENLQSDARFAESFLRARVGRGYGPARIRPELRERGISDDLIRDTLAEGEHDWWALSRAVLLKKFGSAAPEDCKARARRQRFLQYRGFREQAAVL